MDGWSSGEGGREEGKEGGREGGREEEGGRKIEMLVYRGNGTEHKIEMKSNKLEKKKKFILKCIEILLREKKNL